jgi:hypothetical protein
MDPEIPESQAQASPPTESDSSAPTRREPSAIEGQAPPDAAALVDRMVAAGEWPEPALLEQIAQAGDAAVEPLIAVLRTSPRGWPAEAPLDHAIGLLSMIRPPRAIPELIEIVRGYAAESGEAASEALGRYGTIAFEPLLELCRDPAVTGYKRSHAIHAAIAAAGADPALRARLAAVIRPYLAEAMERVREEIRSARAVADLEEDKDETLEAAGDDFDEADELARADAEEPSVDRVLDVRHVDLAAPEPARAAGDASVPASSPARDEAENELDPVAQLWFHVSDLSALADPLARDLIKTAFDEELVETFWIDEELVERRYREGGEPVRPVSDWLHDYRDQYQREMDLRYRPLKPLVGTEPRHPGGSVEPEETPAPMVQETIRNVGPKLGRNDPCWCGSGKKYKKCHLGKDSLT